MSSHKILVVEYREDLRNVVASFLCSQGYEVIEAGDGQEAIKAAISLDPEFILLNLHLPDIDGEEVARALHEIPAIKYPDCWLECCLKAIPRSAAVGWMS